MARLTEFQAASRLAAAATMLNREPSALSSRYHLQTLVEIGVEKNTTVVFPLPLELLGHLGMKVGGGAASQDKPLT